MATDHARGARDDVAASPAALEVINRLSAAAHGPRMFSLDGLQV
jgi:hypothetical protein